MTSTFTHAADLRQVVGSEMKYKTQGRRFKSPLRPWTICRTSPVFKYNIIIINIIMFDMFNNNHVSKAMYRSCLHSQRGLDTDLYSYMVFLKQKVQCVKDAMSKHKNPPPMFPFINRYLTTYLTSYLTSYLSKH